MKFYKFIIIILIVFLKTGNVLSNDNIFNVNNIELIKKEKTSNQKLVNDAIKKGFSQLTKKILLEEDAKILLELNFNQIKDLVSYYQVVNKVNDIRDKNSIIFNITFDKDKLHNLFYTRGISYSQIIKKELFLLPIFKKNNQIYIYRQNFFYNNWNNINEKEAVDFILPQENIEIIQNININKNNLLDIELNNLFKEYPKENLALVFILIASISTNLIANFIPSQYTLINFAPSSLNFRSSSFLITVLGFFIGVFWLTYLSQVGILSFVDTFGAFFGPLFGIMISDFYFIKKRNLINKDIYSLERDGVYYYSGGWHIKGVYSVFLGFIFSASTIWNTNLMFLQSFSWLIGAFVTAFIYYLLAKE